MATSHRLKLFLASKIVQHNINESTVLVGSTWGYGHGLCVASYHFTMFNYPSALSIQEADSRITLHIIGILVSDPACSTVTVVTVDTGMQGILTSHFQDFNERCESVHLSFKMGSGVSARYFDIGEVVSKLDDVESDSYDIFSCLLSVLCHISILAS